MAEYKISDIPATLVLEDGTAIPVRANFEATMTYIKTWGSKKERAVPGYVEVYARGETNRGLFDKLWNHLARLEKFDRH